MRAAFRPLIILPLLLIVVSPILAFGQPQIPFDGLQLTYFSETTQTLQERAGIHAAWWTSLLFHNVSATSSKMDVNVNETIAENGQQQAERFNVTVDFPTNRDTLIFLRNGGQNNLTIYAGPSELTIPSFPGLAVDLTRSWNLYDKPLLRTPLGAFSAYRYHTAVKSIQLPNEGTLDLDFYASYEMNTQVLIAGEVWATLNGSSAMIAETEIREANVFSTPGSSRCLIATATYGSDLAPQVQFLRDFRDQRLESTFAGYNFMTAFNLWYYSFSPSVAGTIYASPQLQGLMRILLYPLIVLLHVSAAIFNVFRFQPELAAVQAGLVASGLLGVFYLWAPSLLICKRYKNGVRRTLKPLVVILGGAFTALVISEILVSSLLAALSSATLVLSNLLLFAALPGIFPNLNSVVRLFSKKRL